MNASSSNNQIIEPRHTMHPNSTIDLKMHQEIIKRSYDNGRHYTQNLDYFIELVRELENDAEEFDFEEEMHHSLYNSNTFEYLVASNPYVIKQVPENLVTTRMIDEIVNNCPLSFNILCGCEVVMNQGICKKILDQMESSDDFYDATVYENIIHLFPNLVTYSPYLNQLSQNGSTSIQTGIDSYEEYNLQIDNFYRRNRSEEESETFQNKVNDFLNHHRTNTNSPEQQCPICYNETNCDIELDCKHSFCQNCISSWIKSQDTDVRLEKTCPCCRTKINI